MPVYAKMEVSAEWDQTANFDRLKTYAWLPESPERMQDSKINYMLLEPRVTGSADIDLRFRGYKKVDLKDADFLVGYHVVKEEGTEISVINSFYGFEPSYKFWGGGMAGPGLSNPYVERYTRGTLIIDIVDPAANKLIWRGYATAVVDPDAPLEDKTEIIQDATEQILKNFASRV